MNKRFIKRDYNEKELKKDNKANSSNGLKRNATRQKTKTHYKIRYCMTS